MNPTEKTALRAARLIRQQLCRAVARAHPHRLSRWVLAQLAPAHAADRLRPAPGLACRGPPTDQGSRHEVEYCRQRLGEFARQLQQTIPKASSHRVGHLSGDHGGPRRIFGGGDRSPNGEISITTDPIVLDDTHLGPFQVRLDWNRLGSHQPYRVVALDPHPAAANEAVTHPHVQEEHLCEGEGRAGIESALNTGRLCDFFLIVSRLLGTYARGSAFVELDDWEGIRCQDCGG